MSTNNGAALDLRKFAHILRLSDDSETKADWLSWLFPCGHLDLTETICLEESHSEAAYKRWTDSDGIGPQYSATHRAGIREPQFFDNEWLNTEQAAEYLGISAGSLRNMTSNGHVPYYKLGRRNRYRRPDLHELLLSEKRGS
ncbi:MAG: helix-turn-helix domain-containing protein [Oligoflexia bacterium]